METGEIENKLILLEEDVEKVKKQNAYFKAWLIASAIITAIVCWSAYIIKIVD